jgi:hypothetical protein
MLCLEVTKLLIREKSSRPYSIHTLAGRDQTVVRKENIEHYVIEPRGNKAINKKKPSSRPYVEQTNTSWSNVCFITAVPKENTEHYAI